MLERINFERINFEKFNAYDLHYHTEYSIDSRTPLNDVLRKAAKLNVGLAITDHNVIEGNLKAQNNKFGVDVIPGIEVTFKDKRDLIFLFYKPSFLEKFYEKYIRPNFIMNYNKIKINTFDFLDFFEPEKEGCMIIAPHPLGMYYKNLKKLFDKKGSKRHLNKIIAFEIFNSLEPAKNNLRAIKWAYEEKKQITGGSDGHTLEQLGFVVTYTSKNRNILESIKKGKNYVTGSYSNYIIKTKVGETIFLTNVVGQNLDRAKNNINKVINMGDKIKVVLKNKLLNENTRKK